MTDHHDNQSTSLRLYGVSFDDILYSSSLGLGEVPTLLLVRFRSTTPSKRHPLEQSPQLTNEKPVLPHLYLNPVTTRSAGPQTGFAGLTDLFPHISVNNVIFSLDGFPYTVTVQLFKWWTIDRHDQDWSCWYPLYSIAACSSWNLYSMKCNNIFIIDPILPTITAGNNHLVKAYPKGSYCA